MAKRFHIKINTAVFSAFSLIIFSLILQGCGSSSSTTAQGSNNSAGSNQPPPSPTPQPPPGNITIPTRCNSALPANAQAANVSNPTKVIGTGTAASCTFAALKSAVAAGGIITFNCGSSPVTIPVTATMNLPTNVNTVIDGGGLITLDGQSAVQILRYESSNFMVLTTKVTLQNLTLINGKTTPVDKIPTAPAPCSQGYDDGQGGAIFMRDGNLAIINCTFSNNQAATLGPDTGGGAIYILGSKSGLTIVNSVFMNNKASNGGAVAGLFAQLEI